MDSRSIDYTGMKAVSRSGKYLSHQGGFTLRGLLIGVTAFAILADLAAQYFAAARWESRRMSCASNLRFLHQSRFNYDAHRCEPTGNVYPEMGGDFFLALQRPRGPIINLCEPFFCPLSGDPVGPNRTSYRGPARLDPTGNLPDPIAADKEGNHGSGRGGNVLTKLGDVKESSETDPLWIRARTTTKE
jgi:hypothetical protein